MKFDLCVIGGGPAGFAGAMRAVDKGKKVLIVEKDQIGGAGVKWGALSSKCLWELSKDYFGATRVSRGYRASGLQVDVSKVLLTVDEAVKQKQYQMLSQIETYKPDNVQGTGELELLYGDARFIDKNHIEVKDRQGKMLKVEAEHFLIATGSRPREFPGIPTDKKIVHDSSSILGIEKFPGRILIVGAGIIGCEYATIFSNFKQSKVFLLDHAERILPFEDPDIAGFISKNLTKNGVRIYQKGKLKEVRSFMDSSEAVIEFSDGHSRVLDVDMVLVCVGRIPNTDTLNLESLGIEKTARGHIIGEDNTKATDNIYIAGDITQSPGLVNIAELEARQAVEKMYNPDHVPKVFQNFSTIMFFKPEVAAIGLNEQQCREKGIAYKVAFYSNALVNRSISMRSLDGFVKILMDVKTNKVIGMRAAGPQASSLVMVITMIMDREEKVDELLRTVHPHPSMTEGIQECLRLLVDKSIYKPSVFPDYIKVREWAPENEETTSE
jgi:dihydrolipoamide dehydrogenase